MSFASDIKRFSQKTDKRISQARRKIVLDLFRSVILDTPVDTGRARGNWQTNVGEAARGTIDRADKEGTAAIQDVLSTLSTLTDDEVIHLTNNLPYIIPLEQGSSQQAPHGMVARNVRRFQQVAAQVAAEARR